MCAILPLEHRFVRWPNAAEKRVITAHVQKVNGFKGAFGFFDGTTFKLKFAPPKDPECYLSRKLDYYFNADRVRSPPPCHLLSGKLSIPSVVNLAHLQR